jgi:hypothetical protein
MLQSIYAAIYSDPRFQWTTVLQSAADTWDDVLPDYGEHAIYENQARSDQASTPSNLLVFLNGNLVSVNNHFQRLVGQDAATSFIEGTSANGMQAAGNTSVTGFYSPDVFFLPFFRAAGYQRVVLGLSFTELAALSQQLLMMVQKQQIAGTLPLIAPVSAVQFRHPVAKFSGTMRRGIIRFGSGSYH